LKTILDNDRKERVKQLYPTFSLSEISKMYGVSRTRIWNIITPNAKEKEKQRNKKYFDKLKTDKDRKAKADSVRRESEYHRYHSNSEVRSKKLTNNKINNKKWRKDPDNKRQDNDNYNRRYSIRTGKFIREFFEMIEDDKKTL